MVMGEFTERVDVLIIGGGPGGYAAAFRGADLGLEVTIVEMEARLGGVCLLRGCIPSKSLLYAAELLHDARNADKMGISFETPKLDLDKMRKWKDGVINRLSQGISRLCEKRNIQVIKGRARFEDSKTVRLLDSEADISHIQFKHAIIATGSNPISIPGTEFKKNGRILSSSGALDLVDIPDSLLVVGGGYVGAELGSVYASLGSKVTLVEMGDHLMPGADKELVDILADSLKGIFHSIHYNTMVKKMEETDKEVRVVFEGDIKEKEASYDRVLVAIGRRPNSQELGLDNTSVNVDDKGYIQVDERLCTEDKNILAIGDVVGGAMLAHKAMYEGKVAAEVIAGKPSAFDARAIPAVVYTFPQLAWCGLMEKEAKEQGIKITVGRFPWSASGRAASMGLRKGLTKMIMDAETGHVLGVGIVGHEAAEMISEGVLAVEMGALAEDVALSIHPHPTLSETEQEAAEAFLGSSTHILSSK
jgi:dihydrolipoamide dehydrogenase